MEEEKETEPECYERDPQNDRMPSVKKKKKKRKRLDVKMEVISEQPNKIAPLVGYFPSGYDPEKYQEDEQPSVSVFRNKLRPNRLQLVVSPNNSKVDFVGTNYTGEATAPQVCTYALGILDKETQSLKVVPIASNKIFRLEPRIVGLEMCDEEPLEGLKEETVTSEKKADKIRDLTNLYGSKKAKARALKMESLNQKEDPSAEGDMARKIEGLVINKEDLDTIAYTARNIPPHDSTAMIPERAYPLDKIIFKGEWDYLLDVLELLQSGAEIRPNSHPSFVCNRIHRLMEIQDETERKVLACIFSYITHLLKFKDQRSVDNAASAKQHKIPAILRQKFSKMFEDSGSFRLSIEKTNLLISYVLVLTLFADNFRTDLSDIAKDLRMTPVSLRQHYEYLGCKFSRVDQVLLVTLPVPLEFPKQRMHRRRK
ncbi:hypothetical protein NE237_032707 [Protea cynaroides]|uniref:DNA-directed RNA polymerase I subunit rpa49 n=1 Tax=Protea cynaroides TaxID=273540 RepID=A0A9Q0R3T7_9MAGN|nr:hypothetical protein NE237_032707 [Protea cynaroides]